MKIAFILLGVTALLTPLASAAVSSSGEVKTNIQTNRSFNTGTTLGTGPTTSSTSSTSTSFGTSENPGSSTAASMGVGSSTNNSTNQGLNSTVTGTSTNGVAKSVNIFPLSPNESLQNTPVNKSDSLFIGEVTGVDHDQNQIRIRNSETGMITTYAVDASMIDQFKAGGKVQVFGQ